MFRTKIFEIQVLLSSFDFIRIEYQYNWTNVLQKMYVTSVKAGIYWWGVCFFTVWVWHFVKGSILNRILRSCELSEGNRFVFMENPRESMCQGKEHLVQYRSNIWQNLFNNEACHKALTYVTGSVAQCQQNWRP